MFSFPAGGAGAGGSASEQPNFSFNFAASQPNAEEKKSGEKGEGDDDEEDDEDPVEEFIKSQPEPVQKCIGALDALDEEVCELEAQFRKEMRDLERKVRHPVYCAPRPAASTMVRKISALDWSGLRRQNGDVIS